MCGNGGEVSRSEYAALVNGCRRNRFTRQSVNKSYGAFIADNGTDGKVICNIKTANEHRRTVYHAEVRCRTCCRVNNGKAAVTVIGEPCPEELVRVVIICHGLEAFVTETRAADKRADTCLQVDAVQFACI